MNHTAIDNIRDTIRDLHDLILFLETELECAYSMGRFDDADHVYGELLDARKQLEQLQENLA